MDRLLDLIRTADPLALYGAVTGTLGLLFASVAAFNALFDRPWLRLKVSVQRSGSAAPNVEVVLFNSGRRKAVCYPPHLRVYDRKLKRFITLSADQVWADGHGWYEDEERDLPIPAAFALNEYESAMYLFNLEPSFTPLWAAVTDSLHRKNRTSIRFGRVRYAFYRILTFAKRSTARGKALNPVA